MSQMKESGIEWIGDIPKYWEITPLFTFLDKTYNSIVDGPFGSDMKNEEYVDEGIPVIQLGAIRESGMDFSKMHYITEEKADSLIRHNALPNDIAIAKMMPAGKACEIPDTFERYVVSADVIKASVSNNDKRKFLIYALNSYASKQAEIESQGSTRARISISKAKKMKIACPSISDISSIVKYLDEKCNEIDSISDDIRKEIETLQEYRKSVITEAVTKGLDPNVEMKDSGVEWIGMIPNSWELEKGKYVFIQKNERGNTICLQLLSPTQKYGVIPQDKYEELSGMKAVKLNEKVDLSELKTVHKGAFCISLRSFQGGFEYSDYEGVVSPAYQIFYPTRNICDDYYRYLFKTQGFIQEMNSFTMSLRDGKNIAFEDFGNSLIPVPPLSIQNDIATFLNTKCSEIDSIIADKQKQLDVLAEYRKSLIYEYVTGKKEVPTK